ncbi:ComGF family competence protein [Gracilibacillus sp. S3-1-1]|uniref:ComGF family competence protein n=1 Tax=Gracilibacillus pellucidus TaxID=3095368 RepID=A0ACC6M592_9BACI|nr:ComGF family competence protein [Gracilibacillus sp. S3-1-1]MDX8045997.1 ComGF family competence protein [Gracilibacillus sp. S3-1-1]
MPKKNKQKNVIMRCKNEQGYLLVEALLSLLFLIMLITWFSQILSLWLHHDKEELPMFYHFHHIVELEAQTATSIYVEDNQLHFIQTNDDHVVISFHNNKIRRQVNGSGHEEILRQITDFNLSNQEKDIVIQLVTIGGEQIEKKMSKITPK